MWSRDESSASCLPLGSSIARLDAALLYARRLLMMLEALVEGGRCQEFLHSQ